MITERFRVALDHLPKAVHELETGEEEAVRVMPDAGDPAGASAVR